MKNIIRCPLVNNEYIDDIDCIENIDVVDGLIKDTKMPKKFKQKENWREMCSKCKYHNID